MSSLMRSYDKNFAVFCVTIFVGPEYMIQRTAFAVLFLSHSEAPKRFVTTIITRFAGSDLQSTIKLSLASLTALEMRASSSASGKKSHSKLNEQSSIVYRTFYSFCSVLLERTENYK
jgi:hypothetical protein